MARYVPSHAGTLPKRARAAEPSALRAVGVIIVVAVAAMIGADALAYPGGDARFAIGWGNAIVNGDMPSFDGIVPTKHPLTLAVGTIFSIPGDDVARFAFSTVSLASFVGLGAVVFRLASMVAGPLAGALACALVLTRPEVTDQALSAGKELPFVALVLLALVLALGGARENRYGVLAALGTAGLIRPEAWLLAAGFAVWIVWLGLPEDASRRALLAAALAAPLIWIATDLVLTGDPTHSFTHEGGKQEAIALAGFDADTGRQEEALDRVGLNLEIGIEETIGWPLTIAGLIVLGASLAPGRRTSSYFFQGWTTVAAAVIGMTIASLVVLPFFDQPFAARFFLLPGVVLAILAATGIADARRSPPLAAALAIAAVFFAIGLPGDITAARDAVDAAEATRENSERWISLGEMEEVRSAANECEGRAVISNERRHAPFARVSFATAVDLSPDSFTLGATEPILEPGRASLVLTRPGGERPDYMIGVDLTEAKTFVRDGRWAFASTC